MKRYTVDAYCYRCGSAQGTGAVELSVDEDEFGEYVKYEDIQEQEKLKDVIKEPVKLYQDIYRTAFEEESSSKLSKDTLGNAYVIWLEHKLNMMESEMMNTAILSDEEEE